MRKLLKASKSLPMALIGHGRLLIISLGILSLITISAAITIPIAQSQSLEQVSQAFGLVYLLLLPLLLACSLQHFNNLAAEYIEEAMAEIKRYMALIQTLRELVAKAITVIAEIARPNAKILSWGRTIFVPIQYVPTPSASTPIHFAS